MSTKPTPTEQTIDAAQLGEKLPRRGNRFSRALGLLFLGAIGWRVSGEVPNLSKFIIIGAPHTSNWDFILVMATAAVLNIHISWMAKHSLFRGPTGPFFRWLGGIPIDRRKAHGVVGEYVEAFGQRQHLLLCITPEGTRTKVREWKSGFYQIATKANVPILLAAFDYGKKQVRFGPMVTPSGDYEKDLAYIKSQYALVQGKYPEMA